MSRPNKRYYKKPISTITKNKKNDVRDRILKAFESRYDGCDQTQNVVSPVSSLSLPTKTRQRSREKENLKNSSLSFMGNTNKKKPKRKIQRRVLDSSSSDEKDEVIVISPSVNVPSPEDSQTVRRKKRKTRAERNKTSGLSTKSNKSEIKSTVAKHISTTQTLTKAGEHEKENDTSLSKISNTRLTKKLGLFSHGKKSSIIGREPIIVKDSVRKKTEDDIWKIIHSDKEEDRPTKMDIDEIISPRDEVLPLPQRKHAKSLSSVELLVPPRPSHKTPLSHHSTTTPSHQQSIKSTTTGISTGCSTGPQVTHSDDCIQKSPPLKDVYDLIMNSIKKKNTVSKKEYVQEMCDDLKKLMKLNASTTATPMSTRIESKTFSNNGSTQRSLLQSFLQNNSADEKDYIYSQPDKCTHNSTNQTAVRDSNSKDKEMKMITCSQSPTPLDKSAFIDAKLLLQHNDIMELSRPKEANNPEMMDTGTGSFGDGSRTMSLSQSSGFHSVRSAHTPTIEQLFRDSGHNILDHRQNLRTAIERASRPVGTIRSTEAVVTELHPQFMPGFHGEFYKDTIERRDSVWHETNYNSHQPQKHDILDLFDTRKPHQNHPPQYDSNHHSSRHNQVHHHSGHHHQMHHHPHHQHQLDHYNQLDHHSNHHHSSHHLDFDCHHHSNHHSYIPLLPISPILDTWNFPPLPKSSPTSPPKLFPQRLY